MGNLCTVSSDRNIWPLTRQQN